METLRIYLVTWNVACRPPEEDVKHMLGLSDNTATPDKLPDLYVVGLQEVKSQIQNIVLDALFDDPWTNVFKRVLSKKGYVKIKTIRLQGLLLSLYSKRAHLFNIRDVDVQYTKTGFGGFWGNKGCVAIRMNISGVSVCLVNTHMTPHDHNLQARIADYNVIIRETTFKQLETSNILFHDYVFWIGDQNFRIEEDVSNDEILKKIKKKQLVELLHLDQLKNCMKSGHAFSELLEEPVNFPPTYKYLFNSSEYDPKRRPAWTDRILYKVNANVYENLILEANMSHYRSYDNYMQSDHKPVSGEFSFKVMSDYTDRLVEFETINTWLINGENKIEFTYSEDVVIADWDWIGVYKEKFSALDEYLSFVYVKPNTYGGSNSRPPSPAHDVSSHNECLSYDATSSRRKTVTFPDGMIRTPGSYCLIYLTSNSGSVLGVSRPFQARFKPGTDIVRRSSSDTMTPLLLSSSSRGTSPVTSRREISRSLDRTDSRSSN